MRRILIAGLALALSATGATARTARQTADDAAYRDDLACAVVFMAVAAQGADQAEFAAGFHYFLGRMHARRPDADWLSQVVTASNNSGQSVLIHNVERCAGIMHAHDGALDRIDEVIDQWSRGEGQMGAALKALGGEPEQRPSSGW